MQKIAFLVFFIFSANLFSKEVLEKVNLQLHWKYQFEFAGFIAAKEKGFYKEAGLDVTLKEYKPGIDIINEVTSGKSHYGVYNSNIIIHFAKNKDVRLLSSYFKRSALVILTQPEIKFPEQLEGKKVMSAGKKDFELNFSSVFEETDLDMDKIDLLPPTFTIDAFKNKEVDAMTAFISDQPYKLDKEGIKYNIIDPSFYGMYNLQMELFTSQKEAKSYNSRATRFREASNKGWEYALNNKEEIIDIILEKYNTQNLTKDFLDYESRSISRLILQRMYKVGSIDPNFIKRQSEVLTPEYKDGIESEEFIFYSDAEKRELQYLNNIKLYKDIFLFFIIVSLVILVLYVYQRKNNIKLAKEIKKATADLEQRNDILKRSNTSFTNLFDSVAEPLILLKQNNKIIKVNKSALKLFGYKESYEMEGRFIDTFFENKESIDSFINEDNILPIEQMAIKSDKKMIPVSISKSLTEFFDKKVYIVSVVNLTEIKRKEKQAQQQNKLIQMGELLSMIAHQWRQPLNAIAIDSANISMQIELGYAKEETIKELADRIVGLSEHLGATISDFRDFYKNDKEKESVEICSPINTALDIIKESIEACGVKVIKEFESNPKVLIFKNEIGHIVLNLMQNALDVLLEKKIQNPYIKISTKDIGNDKVAVEIIDNGGGIPADIFDKIFEPYFSTKLEKEGTGLGLYMSKSIIEKHAGGKLYAQNKENGEVVFTIELKKDIS